MSRVLFKASADLTRLRDEGYFVQVIGGYLVMREVPYVDNQRRVRRGTLISTLDLAGEATVRPQTHVVMFDGAFPCTADGTLIQAIANQTMRQDLGNGLVSQHSFSSKPDVGYYADYYEKMTTYARILSGPASALEANASPRVFRAPESDEESVFHYTETASDRVGIGTLTARLESEVIAIIGLGGSGSYVLDFLAKTPVREIRLFDGDELLQHNAFRAPGAPSIEELREAPKKVEYLAGIYGRMRRAIIPHPEPISVANLALLDGVTFAFLCLDAGDAKRLVVEKLEAIGASFVDCGMGLDLTDGTLGGILRVTASTPNARDRVHRHVSFAGGGADDIYASNIQVADLNAFNAIMAVIKWKKLRGFYRDLETELHSTYTTDGNLLLNEEGP